MDDLPVPALPWSQKTRGALSSVLLIQVVISSRISLRVSSKHTFWVSNPAPPTYGIVFKSVFWPTVYHPNGRDKFIEELLPRSSKLLIPFQIRCTTTNVS